MQTFEEYLYERFAAEISSWRVPDSGVDVGDVYALSFLIDDEVVRPKPYDLAVELSYNTNQWWRRHEPRDSEEARWNYAMWTHDVRLGLPVWYPGHGDEERADSHAAALCSEWRASLQLPLDQDGDPDWEMEMNAFAALCARVGRRLHDEGIIVATFGQPVPIILHNLEYWDLIVQHTREANPPGVADEFIEGVMARRFAMFVDMQEYYVPKRLWEFVAESCRDNAFIRDRMLELAATPNEQGLYEAGLWTSADWAEHDLAPPSRDMSAQEC